MKRYTFKVGNLDEPFDVEALDLHTALYRLGLHLVRHEESQVQPGLTITITSIVKSIRKSKSIKATFLKDVVETENELDRRTEEPRNDTEQERNSAQI